MEPVLSRRQHVVVVGGGAIGCSTAYLLARAGFAVTLLERDRIAAHASGRNAGNLSPIHGALPALISLTLEAFRLHAGVYAELGQLGFANYAITPLKRLHLAFDAADLQHLEQTAEGFKSAKGFSSAWIERDDLRRIVPAIPPEVEVGLLTEGNATLDGEDFCRSLATAAQHLGA